MVMGFSRAKDSHPTITRYNDTNSRNQEYRKRLVSNISFSYFAAVLQMEEFIF